MDPIELNFAAGATITAKVPYGAYRLFELIAYTSQLRFSGNAVVAVDATTTSVPIGLAFDDSDLFVPAYTAIGRIVRVTYASAGVRSPSAMSGPPNSAIRTASVRPPSTCPSRRPIPR